jgi:hypothetical protein
MKEGKRERGKFGEWDGKAETVMRWQRKVLRKNSGCKGKQDEKKSEGVNYINKGIHVYK